MHLFEYNTLAATKATLKGTLCVYISNILPRLQKKPVNFDD